MSPPKERDKAPTPKSKPLAAKRPVVKERPAGAGSRDHSVTSEGSTSGPKSAKQSKVNVEETQKEVDLRTFQFTPFSIPEGESLTFYMNVIHCLCEEVHDQPMEYSLKQIEALERSVSIIDFAVASARVATKRYYPPVSDEPEISTHEQVLRKMYVENQHLRGQERRKLMALFPESIAQKHRVLLGLPKHPPVVPPVAAVAAMELGAEASTSTSEGSYSEKVKSGAFEPDSSGVRRVRYLRKRLRVPPNERERIRDASKERIFNRKRLERAGLPRSTVLNAKFVLTQLAPCIKTVRVLAVDSPELRDRETELSGLDALAIAEECDSWSQVPPAIHVLPSTSLEVRSCIAALAEELKWQVVVVTMTEESMVTPEILRS